MQHSLKGFFDETLTGPLQKITVRARVDVGSRRRFVVMPTTKEPADIGGQVNDSSHGHVVSRGGTWRCGGGTFNPFVVTRQPKYPVLARG